MSTEIHTLSDIWGDHLSRLHIVLFLSIREVIQPNSHSYAIIAPYFVGGTCRNDCCCIDGERERCNKKRRSHDFHGSHSLSRRRIVAATSPAYIALCSQPYQIWKDAPTGHSGL